MSTALNLLRDGKMRVNPFTDEHWRAELKAYGLKRAAFHVDNVCVRWTYIYGRCDDYLNVNMRFDKATKFPQLIINDKLWMSLSPMEIQSSALAIHRATGHVLAVGLGLGYFALRAAAKPDVTKVTVFENEPMVVEWFKRAFKGRPELEKIEIVEGDARKTLKGYTADFAYVDIYRMLLEDTTFTDEKLFRRSNRIQRYMFWGYERIVLSMVAEKMLKHPALYMGNDLRSYFGFWQTTPYSDKPDDGMLSHYCRAQDMPPRDLVLKGKRAIRDFPI